MSFLVLFPLMPFSLSILMIHSFLSSFSFVRSTIWTIFTTLC
uniref:Trehalose 6-phosphate phosphatase n=1 Tax=Rhizophora mucronata TaxID=61149 RepID=A0A2P2JA04_RHIMU